MKFKNSLQIFILLNLILLLISNLNCMARDLSDNNDNGDDVDLRVIKDEPTEFYMSPWRSVYSYSQQKPGCAFCNHLASEENQNFSIINTNRHFSIKMNDNAYVQGGSVMLIPHEHDGRDAVGYGALLTIPFVFA